MNNYAKLSTHLVVMRWTGISITEDENGRTTSSLKFDVEPVSPSNRMRFWEAMYELIAKKIPSMQVGKKLILKFNPDTATPNALLKEVFDELPILEIGCFYGFTDITSVKIKKKSDEIVEISF